MKSNIIKKWSKTPSGVYITNGAAEITNNQYHTNNAFSEKWTTYAEEDILEKQKLFEFQKKWFLKLYGFEDENNLKKFLSDKYTILDAGCGLGYKAAWFAELAPHASVFAIDYSEAIFEAHKFYNKQFPNIFFARGDIAKTNFQAGSIDFTVCDQVIMHTEDPQKTLDELSRVTSDHGSILCYWYRKKALPRELLDEHFRSVVSEMENDEIWELSKGLTDLGKKLSDLKVEIDVPEIPALGIKGGKMDIQRFIYWNFLKCFWNSDLGYSTSLITNFDWYSPTNAKRFSEIEVLENINKSNLEQVYFHSEDACYSGRFKKVSTTT